MSLQFIVGRAGADHFGKLIELLKNAYQKRPHDYYFYLIPNHIKFRSEIETLKRLRPNNNQPYAQINVQILSLTRMGWFFFNQIPMQQHQQISDSGVNMLLYAIIQDHAKDLKLFKSEIDRPGFVSKIAQEISEMQTSQLSADDLAKLYQRSAKTADWNDDLVQKTHDFLIIYKAFTKATHGKYISKEGILDQLCNYLTRHDMSNCHFYIRGFSQLTAQENRLIQILIQKSAGVTVDLDLDPTCKGKELAPYDLFYRPNRLYTRLCSFTRQLHKNDSRIRLLTDISLTDPKRSRVTPDIRQLENYWIDAFQNHVRPRSYQDSLKDPKSVQVIEADNTYSELAQVATRIRQMVASGKYQYSDFLIMTRHLDKFSNVIKPIFNLQQIPIFDDLQKRMVAHPLVRLIGDLFSIYDPDSKRNYQYRDVMDLLKNGLLIPKRDDGSYMDVDEYYQDLYLCENCVLQNGYRGNAWLQDQDWELGQYDDITHQVKTNADVNKRINVIRRFVKKILPPFYQKLTEANTCQDAAMILYKFLVDHGVVDRLKQWRQEEIDRHQLAYAGQNDQVWTVFCNLLDNFVTMLGDHPFRLENFWSLLKAGFEAVSYSQVPPTFDQVVISESKIVQMRDYKVVFMIGSTDDVMPDHIVNDSLFSNTDRSHLKDSLDQFNQQRGTQSYLDDDSHYQTDNEPYLNYLAFMSATQQVIFTYSLKGADESNGGIHESPYVSQMQKAFEIPTQHPEMQPTIKVAPDNQATFSPVKPYLGSPEGTLRHLVQAVHEIYKHNLHALHSFPLPANWRFVRQLLLRSPDNSKMTRKLLDSVHYTNLPKGLDPRYASKLYGDKLDVSISQLESFYKNPYQYFLQYGLRLKPRRVLGEKTFSSSSGLFYHAALDRVLIMLDHKDQSLTSFSRDQLDHAVDIVVNRILTGPSGIQYKILQSSARMKYVKNRLRTTVKAMIHTIYLQSKYYTSVRPVYTEMPFKPHRQRNDHVLSPLDFEVKTHRQLHHILVRGRIDRIDDLVDSKRQQQYFGLVDYKSSLHRFNYGEIYAGTQMQMMTYLDVLYQDLPELSRWSSRGQLKAHVFGALYSLIQDPTLKLSQLKRFGNFQKLSRSDLCKMLLRHQQYNGVLIDDLNPQKKVDLPEEMDRSLRPGSSSILYKALRETIKGKFSSNSMGYLMSRQEFNVIRNWTEDLIRKAGKLIYRGYDRLRPTQFGNWNALQNSPYKSIMEFDPLLPNNNYRLIRRLKKPQDLVNRIQKAKNEGDK